MKIFNRVLGVMLFFCMGMSGCNPAVEVAKQPTAEDLRILSTVTAADHIIAQLGCGSKVLCIDRHGKVLQSMQHAQVAISGNSVSREVLKKYRINCAIVWYYQHDLIELLRKEKIYTVVIGKLDLENYPATVELLGDLCGKTAPAADLIQKYQQQIKCMPQAKNLKNVYFELYAPWKTPAKTGFISSIVKRAGGNLAATENGGTISPENVCMAKVEAIFYVENFGSAGEIASRSALQSTPAVKNNRIYAVPRHLVSEGVAPTELLKFLHDKMKDI